MSEGPCELAVPSRSVWIRVEEAPDVGSGHFTRCFALALALIAKGCEVVIAYSRLSSVACDQLDERRIRRVQLPRWEGEEAAELDARAMVQQIDSAFPEGRRPAIVVDVYRFDADWHRILRPVASTLVVVDDLSNRPYDCDLLIDPALNKSEDSYSRWLQRDCQLCLGPRFAILREQFLSAHPGGLERGLGLGEAPAMGPRVMVTMGGMDERNLTSLVIRALSGLELAKVLDVTVVVGAMNAHGSEVAESLAEARFPGSRLLRGVRNMAERLAPMDLCISAAGSTLWECCALAIPTLAVQTADNQADALSGLERAGAVVALNGDGPDLESSLADAADDLIRSPSKRMALSHRARAICDGRGAERVACRIVDAMELALERVA